MSDKARAFLTPFSKGQPQFNELTFPLVLGMISVAAFETLEFGPSSPNRVKTPDVNAERSWNKVR